MKLILLEQGLAPKSGIVKLILEDGIFLLKDIVQMPCIRDKPINFLFRNIGKKKSQSKAVSIIVNNALKKKQLFFIPDNRLVVPFAGVLLYDASLVQRQKADWLALSNNDYSHGNCCFEDMVTIQEQFIYGKPYLCNSKESWEKISVLMGPKNVCIKIGNCIIVLDEDTSFEFV